MRGQVLLALLALVVTTGQCAGAADTTEKAQSLQDALAAKSAALQQAEIDSDQLHEDVQAVSKQLKEAEEGVLQVRAWRRETSWARA